MALEIFDLRQEASSVQAHHSFRAPITTEAHRLSPSGLKNSGLLVEAFRGASTHEMAMDRLENSLNAFYRGVVDDANKISSEIEVPFKGLDTSVVPSLQPEESITLAFKARGIEFGAPGTLALCGVITSAVKSSSVPKVGYCGIMLPVMEDVGLAKASDQNRFGIIDLLAYSSVCGVGLDMVPVAGDIELSNSRAFFWI